MQYEYASVLTSSMYYLVNDAATPAFYTLSLHDALPILLLEEASVTGTANILMAAVLAQGSGHENIGRDRKSTRLNSSHVKISYAVFCLKKKKKDADSEEANSRDAAKDKLQWRLRDHVI